MVKETWIIDKVLESGICNVALHFLGIGYWNESTVCTNFVIYMSIGGLILF